MSNISENVVIMTSDELNKLKGEAFQRGVQRGRYDRMEEVRPELDKLTKRVKELETRLYTHENYEP